MNWTLAGYFPKRRMTRSDWALRDPANPSGRFPWAAPAEEICSASRCIAEGPEGWRNRAELNALNMFDSPQLAWRPRTNIDTGGEF